MTLEQLFSNYAYLQYSSIRLSCGVQKCWMDLLNYFLDKTEKHNTYVIIMKEKS